MKKINFFNRYLPLIRICTILIGICVFFKMVIFLFPFTFGFLMVKITRPFANYLNRKFKLRFKYANIISLISFYFIFIIFVFLLIYYGISELFRLSEWIKANYNMLNGYGTTLILNYKEYLSKLSPDIQYQINMSINKIILIISDYILNLSNFTLDYIYKLPKFILYVIISIISSFLMVNNLEKIKKFYYEQFPESWIKRIKIVKIYSIDTVFKYFTAQLIITSLAIIVLFLCLIFVNTFIRPIEYLILITVICAILDPLPLIGIGPVFHPWTLYLIIKGDYIFAFSIFSVNVIVSVVRMLLEPYILTDNFNLHPIVALIAMFTGYIFFGVVGFLIGLIVFSVLKELFKDEINEGLFKYILSEN